MLSVCTNRRNLNAKKQAYQGLAAIYKRQQSIQGLQLYIKTKKILESITEFEATALLSHPVQQPFSDRGEAHFSLAVLLKGEEKVNEAAKHFQCAIDALLTSEKNEDLFMLVEAYRELADCYLLAQRQLVETGVCLRKALQVVEEKRVEFYDLPTLYESLMVLYSSPEMLVELERDIERKCPDLVQVNHVAAILYFSQGNWDQSLHALTEAVLLSMVSTEDDLHISLISSLHNSGALCGTGRFSEAKEELSYATELWQAQEETPSTAELRITENRYLILNYLFLAKKYIDNRLSLGKDALCTAAFLWAVSDPTDVLLFRTFSQLLSDTQPHFCEVERVTRKALEHTEAVAEDPLGIAYVYLLLAWRNILEGRFDAAEEVCCQSIKVLGTIQDTEQIELRIAQCALADIYTAQKKLKEAIHLWLSVGKEVEIVKAHFAGLLTQTYICSGNVEIALEKSPAETTTEGFAKAYYLLGWLYYQDSQLQEAIQCLNWSLAVHEKLGLGESVTAAYCYGVLAQAYRAFDQPQTALPPSILALRLLTHHFGANHVLTARCCLELARVYQELGNVSEAQSFYMAGVAVLKNELGEDDAQLNEAYVQLSRLGSQYH